jgi:AraC-like DNA-binding protein
MQYREHQPSEILADHIDIYWTLETGPMHESSIRRIIADGCTEIFVNIGSSTPCVNAVTLLHPGHIYLGGTMTGFSLVSSHPLSRFVGIRFKPSGFSAFYDRALDELVDRIIDFPDKELLELIETDESVVGRLNSFFEKKMREGRRETIIEITATIESLQGNTTVEQLAASHHVSIRTLERIFSRHIGIPPKEFIKIIRFQHTIKRLQNNSSGHSLLQIAADMGYYDHAHLAREIKTYSGLSPSAFMP